jgi:glucokinase
MRVLAGDIGGTKTAVAVVEISAERLSIGRFRRYESGRHGSLEEILGDFLSGERSVPRVAAFGVAGPVVRGRSRITKLPWTIDERALSKALSIPAVRVENDFVAAAMGIPYLGPRQTALLTVGGARHPMASQGGHADFAPRSPVEDRLVSFVRERFGRTSRDRLLSGEGLAHIYDFLLQDGAAPESESVRRAFESEDRGAVIGRLGVERRDALCAAALDLFVRIYGSESGNLALQYRATGGVWVGGGIAGRILPALRGPAFMDAFRSKPPMEDLLARIPVRVVLEPRLGLYGAAALAYRTTIRTRRFSSRKSVRLSLR